MRLRDMQLTISMLNGGREEAILCGKTTYSAYKDGQKVSDQPTGIKYTVALIGNKLTNLDVKVPGADTTPHLTDEVLATRTAAMDFVTVTFTDSSVKFFQINGNDVFTATAKAIQLVNENIDFGSK